MDQYKKCKQIYQIVFLKRKKNNHCEGSRGLGLGFGLGLGRRLGLGFNSFQSFKSRF